MNQNTPVNESKISRIKPVFSSLSVLYFYSKDEQGNEKTVRAWYYDSEEKLLEELAQIQLNHPHIPVS